MRSLRRLEEHYDVVVIGGGLAGICATVAAARLGSKVCLVQDRPVLGGMSSSEVRTVPVGATGLGYRRHSRETGIIEELEMESWHRSEGYDRRGAVPYPFWDLILKEWVEREPNAILHLNTYAMDVEMRQDGSIGLVRALQSTTETIFTLVAPIFVDASGDGTVAYLAGADFRVGREAKSETGERWAQDVADTHTLPSTIRYAARDWGRPIKFIRPAWARVYRDDEDLPFRDHRRIETGYWWVACGGTADTISDAELIRDQLYAISLGVWDHIKNRGDHGAANFALEWIGHVPCKRESRRFLGDHILTQQDIENLGEFPDRVAYGGWPIDVHSPEGIEAFENPTRQMQLDAPYSIPLRCLYSRNVPNLFLAGRNISQTHVALGSSRVMKTCAVMGQAVGTAAHFCVRYGKAPREITRDHIAEIQQRLLKDDAYVIDLSNQDSGDLALTARANAPSSAILPTPAMDDWIPLTKTCCQIVPITAGRVERLELLLRSSVDQDTRVELSLTPAKHIHDFRSAGESISTEATVPGSGPNWVRAEFNTDLEPGLYRVEVKASDGISWAHSKQEIIGTQAAEWVSGEIPGTSEATGWVAAPKRWLEAVKAGKVVLPERYLASKSAEPDLAPIEADVQPKRRLRDATGRWAMLRGTFCVRLTPESHPYEAENVNNGTARTYRGTNIWMSDPAAGLPQWIELDFQREVELAMLQVVFNSSLDVNEPGTLEYHHYQPLVQHVSTCVKDYRVLYLGGDSWCDLLHVRDAHQRFHRHRFDVVRARKIRLVVEATWGVANAQVYEIRAYGLGA